MDAITRIHSSNTILPSTFSGKGDSIIKVAFGYLCCSVAVTNIHKNVIVIDSSLWRNAIRHEHKDLYMHMHVYDSMLLVVADCVCACVNE